MSKAIKIGVEEIEALVDEFRKELGSMKMSDGKFTITKNVGVIDRKAKLMFTPVAWIKMQALINEFQKEVGWHGIAYRSENPDDDTYIIKDIIVYPQEVTGSTVTPDQEEYQTWLMEQPDEVFPHIRMQGHSHVYMGTSPSSVDTAFYEEILRQLKDDMFYIFMIYNKKGEHTIKIYDLAKNILFDDSDIKVSIVDEGSNLLNFIEEAKELVREHVYTSVTTSNKDNYKPSDSDSKYNYGNNKSGSNKKYGSSWYGSGKHGHHGVGYYLDDWDY